MRWQFRICGGPHCLQTCSEPPAKRERQPRRSVIRRGHREKTDALARRVAAACEGGSHERLVTSRLEGGIHQNNQVAERTDHFGSGKALHEIFGNRLEKDEATEGMGGKHEPRACASLELIFRERLVAFALMTSEPS
jgi:hypothetical protein